jgi:hypothetical protein
MISSRKHKNGLKGKILRVKQGYNPNSSSIGSIVFALPAALLGITAIFGGVAGIIMAAFMKKSGKIDSASQVEAGRAETTDKSTGQEGERQ